MDDGDSLQSITITRRYPGAGSLTLNGSAVTADQEISASDIGNLVFTPAANANGDSYADLQFTVSDGTASSNVQTLTLDVTAVNDVPHTPIADAPVRELQFQFGGVSMRDSDQVHTHFLPDDYELGDSIWLLQFNDDYTKAVKVQISDNDNGTLNIKTVEAKYTSTSNWNNLTEAQQETYFEDSGTTQLVATSSSATGYGIRNVSINGGSEVAGFVNTSSGVNTEHNHFSIEENSANDALVAQISASDVENDTLSYSLTDDAGGRFSINSTTGEISVADGSLLDHEAQSSHTITVEISDGNGGATTKEYTVRLSDQAEAASISGDDTGNVTEDAASTLTTSGTLSVSDEDEGEDNFTAETVNGTYGSLEINAAGEWSYSADNSQSAIQALGAGATLTDTITVRSADGTTHDVTITITGTNDAPTASANTVTLNEDGSHTFTAANFGFSDVDNDDSLQSVTITRLPGAGSLALNGSAVTADQEISASDIGNLVFTPAANANGDSYADLQFTVSDGTASSNVQTLTLDVTAVNDAPHSVTASGTASVRTLRFTFGGAGMDDTTHTHTLPDDFESGDSFWLHQLNNDYTKSVRVQISDNEDGTVNIKALQAKYVATSTWNSLTEAQQETYFDSAGTYRSLVTNSSGNGYGIQNVSVNDGPQVDGFVNSSNGRNAEINDFVVEENSANNTSVIQVSASDIEGDTLTYSLSDNAGGRFSINSETGDILVNDSSLLNYEDQSSHTVTVEISDGNGGTTTQDYTIYLKDSNDAADISGDDTGSVTEDAAATLTTSGTLSVSDEDDGEGSFTAETVNGTYGSLEINAAGEWSYSADNTQDDIQALSAGATLTDTITVRSDDGTTHDVVITINGTNDAPTASSNTVTFDEDTTHTFTAANFGFSDVDSDDSLQSVTITRLPGAGSLTLNGSAVTADQEISASDIGNLVFTPAANANGDSYADLQFTVSDGTVSSNVQTLTLDVTAVNDAPHSVTASGTASVRTLRFTFGGAGMDDTTHTHTLPDDFESGDSFWVHQLNNDYTKAVRVQISDNEDGTVNIKALEAKYAATSTWNSLTEAQQETFFNSAGTYRSLVTNRSGNGYGIQNVSVNGGPQVDGFVNSSNGRNAEINDFVVEENSANNTSVIQVSASDIEGDTLTYSLSDNAGGRFSINSETGDILVNDSSLLNYEDQSSHTVTVEISDDNGGTTTQDYTIYLKDSNDAADISGDDTGSVTEDAAATLTASGTLSVSDEDDGEGSFTAETVNGTYGSLEINAAGEWSYSADNTQDDIQALSAGATLTDTITVRSDDGTTHDVVITINGTNDAPTASSNTVTFDEDTTHTFTAANFGFSDVDSDDSLQSVTITRLPGAGSLTLNGSAVTADQEISASDIGNLVFTPAANANGDSYADLQFTVSDGTVSSSVQTLTFNVSAVNDGPVVSADTAEASSDGAQVSSTQSVLSNDSDVEDDSLTVTEVNGTTVAASGSTAIEGDYGELSISSDGSWTYSPSDVDIDSDLVAYWNFDEGSGSTAADIAPSDAQANTVTLQNGASFVNDGVRGNALEFDGGSQKAQIANSSELTSTSGNSLSAYTINLEFKLADNNDLNGRQILFEQGGSSNGYNIYIDDGTLYAGAWSTANSWNGNWLSTDLSSVDASDWHQVSLVLDADNNRLEAWFNGVSIGTETASPVSYHNGLSTFGGLQDSTRFHDGAVSSGSYGYNGRIDEARIYDRALSHQEINTLKFGTAQDVFNYTVSDGTDTGESTLTIDVNRAPEGLAGTLSATEDGGVIAGQLSAIDRDEGDSLTYSVESQPSEGSVTVNSDGSYNFNPGSDFQNLAAGETRDVTFDYRVTDSEGDYSTNTVTVTVTGVNDTPTLTVSNDTATGLNGEIYDTNSNINNLDDLDNLIANNDPTATYSATSLNYANSTTIGGFLGSDADSLSTNIRGNNMDRVGFKLTGYIKLSEGSHDFSVMSDDGFRLTINGTNVTEFFADRAAETSTGDFDAPVDGYYSFELVYFENTGGQRLRVTSSAVDGDVLGSNILYDTIPGLSYTENDVAAAITDDLVLNDTDIENHESATITITNGYVQGQDELVFTNQNGITGSWDAATGTLTLSGSASQADYQTALRSVAYRNSSDDPDTGDRIVSYTVSDGDASTSAVTRIIEVNAVNDAPELTGSYLLDQSSVSHTVEAVNSSTEGDQTKPAIATTDSGYVVTWVAKVNDVDTVQAQKFNTDGSEDGAAFQVNTMDIDSRDQDYWTNPDVAVLSNGHIAFAYEWQSPESQRQVYLKILDQNGNVVSNETRVGQGESGIYLHDPRLIALSNDQLALSSGRNSTIHIFNSNGSSVNTITAGASGSELTALDGGGFITSWRDSGTGDNTAAFEIYNSSGTSISSVIQFGGTAPDNDRSVVFDQLSNGKLVALYQSGDDLYLQGFSASGTAEGSAVSVNTSTDGNQFEGEIVALANGRFLVTWVSDDTSDPGLYYRYFDSDLSALTGEIHVSSSIEGSDQVTSVAELDDGTVSIVWQSDHEGDQNIYSTKLLTNLVVENAANGTAIGSVEATDAEGDSISYSLSNDAGGRFAINSSTGEITVADGSLLDFESASSHTITVQMSDGNGGTTTENVIIRVTNQAEAATFSGDDTGSVTEDAAATLTATGTLTVSDEDEGESSFSEDTITGTYGSLTINAAGEWSYSASNSQSDIESLSAGETLTDTIQVQSVDGTTHDVTITIVGTNDAPTFDSTSVVGADDSETVNTTTSGAQNDPDLAKLPDGGYMAVWVSAGSSIRAQKYNADMTPDGNEFQVNSVLAVGNKYLQHPSVAVLDNGHYAVVWEHFNPGNYPGSRYRVFDADGNQVKAETVYSGNRSYDNDIVALTDNRFATIGIDQNNSMRPTIRIMDTNGEFTSTIVEDAVGGWSWGNPELTALDNGGFAAVWRNSNSADNSAVLKIYDSSGTVVADNITFGGAHPDNTRGFSITELSNGNIAVVYQSAGEVYVQRWDGSGNAVGSAIQVSSSDGEESNLKIEALQNGEFFVAWDASGTGKTGRDIIGRHYDADGDALSDEMVITSNTAGDQQDPQLIQLDSGELKILWMNDVSGDTNVQQATIGVGQVAEHTRNGTLVGQVTASDVESDSLTYSLSDSVGGRFAIDSNTGQITVADGSLLDYETSTSHTLQVQVSDGTNTTTQNHTVSLINVDIAPTASDSTQTIDEDTSRTINLSDLNYSSGDDIELDHIQISTLPTDGSLTLNGTAVTLNQQISRADIEAGNLVFAPDSHESGDNYTSFGFQVSDGEFYSDESTLSFNVTGVVDTVSLSSSQEYTNTQIFNTQEVGGWSTAGDNWNSYGGHSMNPGASATRTIDTSADNVSYSFTLTSMGAFRIEWNGQAVQTIHNYDNPATSRTITLPDTDQDSTELKVVAVWRTDNNSTSSFVSSSLRMITDSVEVDEDTSVALDINAVFGDTDGSETQTVTLSDVPSGATISDGSNSVQSSGDDIDISGWDFDNLTFTGPSNASGTYDIQVNASTSENGQENTDSLTIRIDVQSVNDAPTAEDNSLVLSNDGNYSFSADDFGFSDVDSGDSLQSITINTLPVSGSLTIDDVALVAGQVIVASEIGNLKYTAPSGSSASSSSFDFTVSDGDASSATATFSINTNSITQVESFSDSALGDLNNQDGWSVISNNTSAPINVVDSSGSEGNSRAITFESSGVGHGADATLVESAANLLPDMTKARDLALEVDIRQNAWGSHFGIGSDVNNDNQISGDSEEALSIHLQGSNGSGISVTLGDGSTVSANASISLHQWVRFRWEMDLDANDGEGQGTLYYRNLTNNDSEWTALTAFTDMNLKLSDTADDASNPENWDAFHLHFEGAGSALDTIKVESSVLEGTTSNNIIQGTDTADTILSGGGDDILIGGDGSDTFIWHTSDAGTAADPAEDTIKDFTVGQGGDVLDLHDMLVDEENHQLDEYLHFNFENGDTTVEVSTEANGDVTQKIKLEGVDLSSLGGSDAEIINSLLNDGNLQVDE